MTESEPVKFGTDGLRGRAGQAPMDPQTLRRVGAALGVLLQREGDGSQRRVLLGDDGRESSPWILESLVQGLMAADVSSASVGLITTPGLALLTADAHVYAYFHDGLGATVFRITLLAGAVGGASLGWNHANS